MLENFSRQILNYYANFLCCSSVTVIANSPGTYLLWIKLILPVRDHSRRRLPVYVSPPFVFQKVKRDHQFHAKILIIVKYDPNVMSLASHTVQLPTSKEQYELEQHQGKKVFCIADLNFVQSEDCNDIQCLWEYTASLSNPYRGGWLSPWCPSVGKLAGQMLLWWGCNLI